jgi:hypothetical protein
MKNRLRLFENRVLRRMFGPKREEVARGWSRLHNEGIHNLYTLPDIIRVIKSRRVRWARHIARMGEMRSACIILVVRPEGKRSLGRRRRRWEDNIRVDLRKGGCGLDSSDSGTSFGPCKHSNETSSSVKG